MKDRKLYSIGMDFGTLSARGVLVDITNGEEVYVTVVGYQDAVIDDVLPRTEVKLPENYALQNPADYIEALSSILGDIVMHSGVSVEDIIGIGIDSTASTVLPVDKDYVPLCMDEKYYDNPHSWPKLWKHHANQAQADQITRVAKEMNAPFLKCCGGLVDAEYLYPKVLQIYQEAPEIYEAADSFVELADWLVFLLTGKRKRSSTIASIHSYYTREEGYPDKAFFHALEKGFDSLTTKKMREPVCSVFQRAGRLTEEMAQQTGLPAGIAVSIGTSDSVVALPSLGIMKEGDAALIVGTSSVLMLLSKEKKHVPGAMAMVKDEMLPGYYGHLFGQTAVGDVFDWFVSNLVPHKYYLEAERKETSIFDIMNEKIRDINPGETGMLALDWFNGNRSVLHNSDLTGMLMGISLSTTTEQIYRALVEATAFGLKKIMNTVAEAEIPVDKIYACGGLARKSPVIMQIYADILGLCIYTVDSSQTVASGAAILGALAAGKEVGGYDTIEEAVQHMSRKFCCCYEPDTYNHEIYESIYDIYEQLHDYFGCEQSDIMLKLKKRKSFY